MSLPSDPRDAPAPDNHERPDDDATTDTGEEPSPPPSDLDAGLEHLSRVVGGVMTRLLGEKITGQKASPDRPVLGPSGDAAIDQIGETLGRWLGAAGAGLKAHPAAPVQAVNAALKEVELPLQPPREGEAHLTEGLRSLGGGLYKSAEAVLDKVAPRRPTTAEHDDAIDPTSEGPSDTPPTA